MGEADTLAWSVSWGDARSGIRNGFVAPGFSGVGGDTGSELEKNTLDGPARVAAFARVRGLLGLRMGFGFSQGPEREDIGQGFK